MKSVVYCLILFAAACVHCRSPDSRQNFRKIIKDCKTEVGISEDPRKLPRDDPKLKCLHACTMKKTGKMENGKVLPEKALEILKRRNPNADESVKEKFNSCTEKANEESDECEVAGAFGICVFESVSRVEDNRQCLKIYPDKRFGIRFRMNH